MKRIDNNRNNSDYESNEYIAQAKSYDEKTFLKRKQERTQDEHFKKTHEMIMFEKLHHGLNKPIESTNKGHKLLLKMGYKEGESLGKNNTGIITPIDVVQHAPKIREKFVLANRQALDDERYNNLLNNKMSVLNEINTKIKNISEQKETLIKHIDVLSNIYYQKFEIKENFSKTIDLTVFTEEVTKNSTQIGQLKKCSLKLSLLSEVLSADIKCQPDCAHTCKACELVQYNNYQVFLEIKSLFDFHMPKFFKELIKSTLGSNYIEECYKEIEKLYSLLQLNNEEIKAHMRKHFLYCVTCSNEFASEYEFEEHNDDCDQI
jgi:hypothetical protein